eukprot:12904052-Prorocentrum_lima.AAC.1
MHGCTGARVLRWVTVLDTWIHACFCVSVGDGDDEACNDPRAFDLAQAVPAGASQFVVAGTPRR